VTKFFGYLKGLSSNWHSQWLRDSWARDVSKVA